MEATGEGARWEDEGEGEGEGQGEGGRLVLIACSFVEGKKEVFSIGGVGGTRARRCLGGVEGEKGRGEEGWEEAEGGRGKREISISTSSLLLEPCSSSS